MVHGGEMKLPGSDRRTLSASRTRWYTETLTLVVTIITREQNEQYLRI